VPRIHTQMVRIGPTLFLAGALAAQAEAHCSIDITTPRRALARASDADRSGDVTGDEQRALLASF